MRQIISVLLHQRLAHQGDGRSIAARMTSPSLFEQGEYQAALAEVQQATSGPAATPDHLLTRFNLEVRLQQYDAARATAARLSAVAPQIMPVLRGYMDAAAAEERAARRLTDPELASKRSTVGLPPPFAIAYVQAAAAHARRDAAAARAALAEARKMAPPVAGTLVLLGGSEVPFADLIDTDELTGPILPCYEGSQLLDLPYADLREVVFGEPKTTLDMMWMPARVTLVDGSVLAVRIPTLYPGSALANDSSVRTGQLTIWERERGYAQAFGQRDLSATKTDGSAALIGIQRVAAMRFSNPSRALLPGGAPRSPAAGPGAAGATNGWTTTEKAVAGLAVFFFLLPRFTARALFDLHIPFSLLRVVYFCLSLACCACVGWVASRRAGKVAGAILAALMFAFTALRWL